MVHYWDDTVVLSRSRGMKDETRYVRISVIQNRPELSLTWKTVIVFGLVGMPSFVTLMVLDLSGAGLEDFLQQASWLLYGLAGIDLIDFFSQSFNSWQELAMIFIAWSLLWVLLWFQLRRR